MLLQFSVGNYLSFKDQVTLNLEASTISDHSEPVFEVDRYKLLRGAAIYGANSSGKSNLILAMGKMRELVLGSAEKSSVSTLDIMPFLLNSETEQMPSHFEVMFLINGLRYRYGFEVDSELVHAEWLFESKVPGGAEFELFTREKDKINVATRFKEGKDLATKTRNNALFLAIVDQFAGALAGRIIAWFRSFRIISGLSHKQYGLQTIDSLKNENSQKLITDFLESLDLGFEGLNINVEKFSESHLPDELPVAIKNELLSKLKDSDRYEVSTLHKKYNEDGKVVEEVYFDLQNQESKGTKKIFDLSGAIFNALTNGGQLVVDEIDASMHPNLMLSILRLFHTAETNPKNAQLIISTHDTNLLTYANYRRDQIYFVEKDKYGASDLYSLVEFKHENGKNVRSDESYEKYYIQGRYGAIPFIGNPENIIRKWQQNQ